MCVCLRNLAGDLVRAEGGEGGGAAGDVCCGFPDPTGCRELLRYAPSPATSASRASGRSEGEGVIGPTPSARFGSCVDVWRSLCYISAPSARWSSLSVVMRCGRGHQMSASRQL